MYLDAAVNDNAEGRVPSALNFGPGDPALAQSARTRMLMGDDSARTVLAGLLLSNDRYTRRLAIGALEQRYDDDRDFDPDGEPDQRREAAMRWMLAQNDEPEYGARPLRRIIRRTVREPLADFLLKVNPSAGTDVRIDADSDGLQFAALVDGEEITVEG